MVLDNAILDVAREAAKRKQLEVVKEIQTELINEMMRMIRGYYGEYKPKVYLRTHNLYRMVKPYYRNHGKRTVEAGIEINSAFMLENYDDPAEIVMPYVYNAEGTKHGPAGPYGQNIYMHMHRFADSLFLHMQQRYSGK